MQPLYITCLGRLGIEAPRITSYEFLIALGHAMLEKSQRPGVRQDLRFA